MFGITGIPFGIFPVTGIIGIGVAPHIAAIAGIVAMAGIFGIACIPPGVVAIPGIIGRATDVVLTGGASLTVGACTCRADGDAFVFGPGVPLVSS